MVQDHISKYYSYDIDIFMIFIFDGFWDLCTHCPCSDIIKTSTFYSSVIFTARKVPQYYIPGKSMKWILNCVSFDSVSPPRFLSLSDFYSLHFSDPSFALINDRWWVCVWKLSSQLAEVIRACKSTSETDAFRQIRNQDSSRRNLMICASSFWHLEIIKRT